MSLLDDVKILTTPNASKAGILYSIKPDTGAADFDITRATTATRVNSSGVVESVAIDAPQLDYSDDSCPCFLVEPQRTNLAFPSATAATQTVTTSAAAHTLSFYGTGSVTLSGTHSATLNGTGASNRVTLTFTPSAGSLTMTVAGTVTNIQLEAGGSATSCIITTVASVTRNRTDWAKTGLSTIINPLEGVLMAEIMFPSTPTNQSIFGLSQSTSNMVQMGYWSGFFVNVTMNGSHIFFKTSFATIDNNWHKIAIKYKSGDCAVCMDGVEMDTSTTTGTPSASPMDKFSGSYGGSSGLFKFYGKIKQLQVYDAILTDAQLLALTT